MLNFHIKEFVSRLRRVWLLFSAWFVLGFVMSLIILRDDPLKSDAPYLLGLVCGTFAAGLSGLWLAIDQVRRLAFELEFPQQCEECLK